MSPECSARLEGFTAAFDYDEDPVGFPAVNPYGDDRPWLRDAWNAGFNQGYAAACEEAELTRED